jgi:excinuclease ABC subunit B
MDETTRRRKIQLEFNREHGITPESVKKQIKDILSSLAEKDYVTVEIEEEEVWPEVAPEDIVTVIENLTKQMFAAARDLEFEKAAALRDRIRELENNQIRLGLPRAKTVQKK